MYHGIIFTGSTRGFRQYLKSIGAYRIRTLCAEQGYNVRVVEHVHMMNVETMEKICDSLISKETFFIGLSQTFLMNFSSMKNIEENLAFIKKKYPKIKFILGGAGQYTPRISNPPWDIRMVGFSDISFKDVLDFCAGKKHMLKHQIYFDGQLNTVHSSMYGSQFDMNKINTIWLPEDDIRPTDALPIEISRGCIFQCDFCSYELNGKKKFDYFRVKDSLVKEIQYNYETFGVKNYVFIDDTYNDSREKLSLVDDVMSEMNFDITYDAFIKPELIAAFSDTIPQLVDQGLVSFTMGIESLNKETRKAISKMPNFKKIEENLLKLKFNEQKKNITFQTTMIAGLPHEPVESIKESYDYFLNECKFADDVIYQPFVMMKGDKEWREREASKIDKNPEKYGYTVYDQTDLDHLDDEQRRHIGRVNNMLYWENEHTNFLDISKLTDEFMQVLKRRQVMAGISGIGAARCAGVDIDDPNGGVKNIPVDDIRKLEENPEFWKRTEDYYNSVINR